MLSSINKNVVYQIIFIYKQEYYGLKSLAICLRSHPDWDTRVSLLIEVSKVMCEFSCCMEQVNATEYS